MGWFLKLFDNSDNNKKSESFNQKQTELNNPKDINFEGSGSSKKVIKDIYKMQRDRLLEWRERYSFEDYPYKIVINIIYQTLQLEYLWNNLQKCFSSDIERFNDINIANVFVRKMVEFSVPIINPIVEQTYKNRDMIGNLDLKNYREMVKDAQNGNNEILEKIEKSYLWYTGGVELMFLWAACGLIGLSYTQAFEQILSLTFTKIDPYNLSEMQTIFGNNINMEYKPLQNYRLNNKDKIKFNNIQTSNIDLLNKRLQEFVTFIELKYKLKAKFYNVEELLNKNDILKADLYPNFYLIKETNCVAIFQHWCKFELPLFDTNKYKVYVNWLAIERKDDDCLASPQGESIINFQYFTEILETILERSVCEVGGIQEGEIFYKRYSWIVII